MSFVANMIESAAVLSQCLVLLKIVWIILVIWVANGRHLFPSFKHIYLLLGVFAGPYEDAEALCLLMTIGLYKIHPYCNHENSFAHLPSAEFRELDSDSLLFRYREREAFFRKSTCGTKDLVARRAWARLNDIGHPTVVLLFNKLVINSIFPVFHRLPHYLDTS